MLASMSEIEPCTETPLLNWDVAGYVIRSALV